MTKRQESESPAFLHALLLARMRRIARHVYLSFFPNIFGLNCSQHSRTVLYVSRNRNSPIAVKRFGRTNHCSSLFHHNSLLNGNRGAILCDVPGFQPKQFLRSYSRTEHQTNIPTDLIFPSPDSDYDVRSIYIRTPEFYFKLANCNSKLQFAKRVLTAERFALQ